MADPTAILVDDEPTLVDYLGSMLVDLWPELRIVGSASNGRQALTLIDHEAPDIVFLDIHMPGLTGLQVAERLSPDTHVVFVTAYDEYAVQAFDRAAVDYLLKPVTAERLQATIDRLKRSTEFVDTAKLFALLRDLDAPSRARRLEWLRAGRGDTVQLVPVAAVVYFRAAHKYTSVFTATDEFVIRRSIKELESELDPQRFWRVHRGLIVRVDEVLQAVRDLRGRYRLHLRSRDEVLTTSQRYGHLFRQM